MYRVSGIGVRSSFECTPPKYEELPRLLLVGRILDNQLSGKSAHCGKMSDHVVLYLLVLSLELSGR
jgi:hypothetical protein